MSAADPLWHPPPWRGVVNPPPNEISSAEMPMVLDPPDDADAAGQQLRRAAAEVKLVCDLCLEWVRENVIRRMKCHPIYRCFKSRCFDTTETESLSHSAGDLAEITRAYS